MIEIVRWIHLSLEFAVGDMLLDLTQSDLDLTAVLQHCRQIDFTLLVSFTSARSPHVCGVRLPPAPPFPARSTREG